MENIINSSTFFIIFFSIWYTKMDEILWHIHLFSIPKLLHKTFLLWLYYSNVLWSIPILLRIYCLMFWCISITNHQYHMPIFPQSKACLVCSIYAEAELLLEHLDCYPCFDNNVPKYFSDTFTWMMWVMNIISFDTFLLFHESSFINSKYTDKQYKLCSSFKYLLLAMSIENYCVIFER
jgi:hypothetical protein